MDHLETIMAKCTRHDNDSGFSENDTYEKENSDYIYCDNCAEKGNTIKKLFKTISIQDAIIKRLDKKVEENKTILKKFKNIENKTEKQSTNLTNRDHLYNKSALNNDESIGRDESDDSYFRNIKDRTKKTNNNELIPTLKENLLCDNEKEKQINENNSSNDQAIFKDILDSIQKSFREEKKYTEGHLTLNPKDFQRGKKHTDERVRDNIKGFEY